MHTFFVLTALLAPAADPAVELELAHGPKVRGAWRLDKLVFTTDVGRMELDPAKVKSLAFGEPGHDELIVLAGSARFVGTAELDRVAVAGQDYPRSQVMRLKHVRTGPPNLLADITIPLITLTAMEIVLGIDNIIFLAIIAGRLPEPQQPKARRIGLILALVSRLGLLFVLSYILGLTATVFTLPPLPFLGGAEARNISWRDIILLVGGVFLIGKSTFEIHNKLEHAESGGGKKATASFALVLVQIAIIDLIFSLDSVITAVGMADVIWVMVVAMVIAVGVMLMFAETISRFVARNPTLKILALAFLILIGVMLVAEGFGQHIPKGYIYFAMAFSIVVEALNIRLRRKAEPVKLARAEYPSR
jgi:predicted tellurium resistance membrane protein TerC